MCPSLENNKVYYLPIRYTKIQDKLFISTINMSDKQNLKNFRLQKIGSKKNPHLILRFDWTRRRLTFLLPHRFFHIVIFIPIHQDTPHSVKLQANRMKQFCQSGWVRELKYLKQSLDGPALIVKKQPQDVKYDRFRSDQ